MQIPGLGTDNVFTGMNTFSSPLQAAVIASDTEMTFVTTDGPRLGANGTTPYVLLDITGISGNRTASFQDSSGTLAYLTDIVGGSGNGVVATVDFGAAFTPYASVVVTGQAWVAAGSKIVVSPKASTGTEVEVAVMAFSCVVSDLVAGTGFTLNVFTPVEAKGTYNFSCVGV